MSATYGVMCDQCGHIQPSPHSVADARNRAREGGWKFEHSGPGVPASDWCDDCKTTRKDAR